MALMNLAPKTCRRLRVRYSSGVRIGQAISAIYLIRISNRVWNVCKCEVECLYKNLETPIDWSAIECFVCITTSGGNYSIASTVANSV